jgi:hypothetical protein
MEEGAVMSIEVDIYAGRNWLITPAAAAVNEAPPSTISDQTWLVVLTGVAVVDLQGDNPHDWRRETLWFPPDRILKGALNYAISRYSIPLPPGEPFFPL